MPSHPVSGPAGEGSTPQALAAWPGPEPAHEGIWAEVRHEIVRLAKIIGEMIYGATIHEMVRDLNKERGMLERLFILAVFGDVLGVPLLPPYYALRLLPYVVPKIEGWRHSLLRERDLTDLCDQEFT